MEQLCSALKDIPFVSDIEGAPAEGFDFAIMLRFADGDEPLRIMVDVSSRGERRFAEKFASAVPAHGFSEYYVFMAPYVSEQTANFLRGEKLGYMDLSGNCHIFTRRIALCVSGRPNSFIERRVQKNYFSKNATAASVIMRTILNEHSKSWAVQELAGLAGKSIGMVSNVKSFLIDHAWAEPVNGGFKLCSIEEMLRAWAADYHKKSDRTIECYTMDKLADFERSIANWNRSRGSAAVLGSFGAAARYAPVVRYNRLNVYVEPQDVREFITDLALKEVSSGGNLIITIPHDESPCLFAKTVSGQLVASPAQTVIDLLSGVGRGEEAADAILQKEFKQA